MQIHELSPEDYLQKRLLTPTNPNIQVDNNLNECSNYSAQPLPIIPNHPYNTLQPQPSQNYQLNFVPVYGQYPQQNPQIPNFEIQGNSPSDYLKDQTFDIQKQEMIQVLVWLLIGSGIEFSTVVILFGNFEEGLNFTAPQIFPVSLMLLLFLSILGQFKTLKQFYLSLIVYISVNILFGITLFSFSRLFNNKKPPKEDGLYFTTATVVSFAVMFQIWINSLVEIIIIIQLRVEKSQIHYAPTLFVIAIATMISVCIFTPFIVTGLIAFFYGLILLITLNRALKGGFNLKIKQVFANVNSITNGIIIPCFQ